MEDRKTIAKEIFDNYIKSFKKLTPSQQHNFDIKRDHSIRVAEMTLSISDKLKFNDDDKYIAFLCGLLHDIGRFSQLIEYDTFSDSKSIDHAELSVTVIKDNNFLSGLEPDMQEVIYFAIQNHNKFTLPVKMGEQEKRFAWLLRDADKLDIFKVLSDYYTDKKAAPNHTLTWELPAGSSVSSKVSEEVLHGKLVSKENVASEMDVKIMQLSWVYDFNYKPSFDIMLRNRFLEKIYSSLPKNDLIIQIYRKVKVYAENKILK